MFNLLVTRPIMKKSIHRVILYIGMQDIYLYVTGLNKKYVIIENGVKILSELCFNIVI